MSPSARREDVSIETADPRVRAARLRRLPAEGFVPPHAAAPDAAFAADVRAFAATFWVLPPADRRARWDELSGRLVGPAAARLADLEPGLGVAPVVQPDPRAAEIADLVRELFVLPPAERAARRAAWLTAADRRGPAWEGASRALLRTDLPLARLEERLFDWFSRGDKPAAVAAVAESEAWVRQPGRPVYEPAPVSEPQPPRYSLRDYLVGLFVVSLVLRGLAAGCSREPTSPPPNSQPVPKGATFQTSPAGLPFSASEVRAFQDYEWRVAVQGEKWTAPPPLGYARWVELDRPTRALNP